MDRQCSSCGGFCKKSGCERGNVFNDGRCIVKDCQNHNHQGLFIGDLCSPCFLFITKGVGEYSQAYRNTTPQREWASLTEEEIEDACWAEVDRCLRSFARAIEAKLKEKNT